jgi:hypothetical protein
VQDVVIQCHTPNRGFPQGESYRYRQRQEPGSNRLGRHTWGSAQWFVVELSLRFSIFIIAKVSQTMGRLEANGTGSLGTLKEENRAALVIPQDRTRNGPRDPLTVIGIGGSLAFDLIGQESTFDENGW